MSERRLFLAGVAAIAAHVLDDTLVQPPAGTGPGDHLVAGLVPLAVLALAVWAYPRLPGALRAALALSLGVLAGAGAVEAVHYANQVGLSGDDFTGLLLIPAALLLLGLGAATLWRTRRTDDRLRWRYPRRALLGFAGLVAGFVLVFPIGLAYVTTHTARAVVPAPELGAAHEDVSFETEDGLRLRGWYVPSRNGAAVISFPGRKGSQDQARMLARHGYGVLLFDRRGEGVSDGAPNSWGWAGERDIAAAIEFLHGRPDVDPNRIGGIGLSVGGEMMIEAAGEGQPLKAFVSDGAGARSLAENADMPSAGPVDHVLGLAASAVKDAAIAVFSSGGPPDDLEDLSRRAKQPMLLISAPNSGHGEELNRDYARAAGANATLWEIPEAAHMGGLEERPAEYERRVVGFFDRHLGR